LLRAMNPPRKPRILTTERSRVIRLGPEARALREAIEAPVTPGPIPIAGPSHKTAPLPGMVVPGSDLMVTPGPVIPLTASRSRAPTPRTPAPARGRRPSSPALQVANGAPAQPMPRAPTRQTPVAPAPALRLSPAQGLPRPPIPNPGLSPGRTFSGLPAFPAPPIRQPRETERVQPLDSRPRWQVPLVLALLLIAGAGAAVHRFLVPLDVLLSWRSPARLAIATQPEGASLRLDGVPLGALSPTVVQVRRDLVEHLIEATHPGFKPAHATVRYDKSVMLSSRLILERDPRAVPVPPPAPAHAPPPPPARPAGSSKRSR